MVSGATEAPIINLLTHILQIIWNDGSRDFALPGPTHVFVNGWPTKGFDTQTIYVIIYNYILCLKWYPCKFVSLQKN